MAMPLHRSNEFNITAPMSPTAETEKYSYPWDFGFQQAEKNVFTNFLQKRTQAEDYLQTLNAMALPGGLDTCLSHDCQQISEQFSKA